eukprot:Selendium_serpulae@DN5363_c0_g2_i1.p2
MAKNVCATQAILSVLFNAPDEVDIGEGLAAERAVISAPPETDSRPAGDSVAELRGRRVMESSAIRSVHNAFKPESSFFDEPGKTGSADAFHYVSYVPFESRVYELDGLAQGPISHGECTSDNWVEVVRPEIIRRIAAISGRGAEGDIRFSLLAITPDLLSRTTKLLNMWKYVKNQLVALLLSLDVEVEGNSEDVAQPEGAPDIEDLLESEDVERLKRMHDVCNKMIGKLSAVQFEEEQKWQKWNEENSRRRHDWNPLVFEALQLLAERGEIMAAYDAGVTAAKAARARTASSEK